MRERARRPPRGSCERLDFCIQGPTHLLSHLTIFSRAVPLLHQHLLAISQIHTASSTLTFTQFLSRGQSTVVMSSQPLLQTAPGKTQSTLSHPRPRLTYPRQAHRPAYPRRAQSLLRQRAYLPLMAQLHRHPRRPRNWAPQLRR
jgi:hypothetical protein